MKVVFRTDSSIQIGSGHVMRCLTLADELRRRGADVMFVCREHPGNLIGIIEGKGYQVVRLQPPEDGYAPAPEDVAHAGWLGASWRQDAVDTIKCLGEERPHWLVVDNYALARPWEEVLRPHVGKIMVIDDLADRPHDCDLLLDQNLIENMERRYDGLLPDTCNKLLGPRFALLRSEFEEVRTSIRERDGVVRRILVFAGGGDPNNETAKVLDAIKGLDRPEIAVDVVVGSVNPHRENIKTLCALMPNTCYYCQVQNMVEFMTNADLAVGAGGSALWERCMVGLPSIILVTAINQIGPSEAVARAGAAWNLGWSKDVRVEHLLASIQYALDNPEQLRTMGKRAVELMGAGMSQGGVMLLQNILMGEANASA